MVPTYQIKTFFRTGHSLKKWLKGLMQLIISSIRAQKEISGEAFQVLECLEINMTP